MGEGFKPRVQQQCRLNLVIKDVVQKEVIKWLDNEVVYLILDSKWVSPIHCILKKGGMIVVTNEPNSLILIRMVTG